MTPKLHRFGREDSPVVTVDGITGDPAAGMALAAALAPFPAVRGSYFPGLRRVLTEGDAEAMSYGQAVLEAAAPFIGGGFDCDGFDLLEASFSMVTAPPETLGPAQRAPHFDSADPDYIAVIHYLSPTAGTAFYRQRSTGIEVVTPSNQADFIARARAESGSLRGYTITSNAAFEQIGLVEGVIDRLAIYRGNLLHSGVIPPGMRFDADPRAGRLTANFFLQARR